MAIRRADRDMSDLAARAVRAGQDLAVKNDAAADTGTKGDKERRPAALAAAFPVTVPVLMGYLAIGIAFSKAGAIVIPAGEATISLSGLAVASLVGIILNAILPGKDYEFGVDEQGDTSVNFKV